MNLTVDYLNEYITDNTVYYQGTCLRSGGVLLLQRFSIKCILADVKIHHIGLSMPHRPMGKSSKKMYEEKLPQIVVEIVNK